MFLTGYTTALNKSTVSVGWKERPGGNAGCQAQSGTMTGSDSEGFFDIQLLLGVKVSFMEGKDRDTEVY